MCFCVNYDKAHYTTYMIIYYYIFVYIRITQIKYIIPAVKYHKYQRLLHLQLRMQKDDREHIT